MHKMSKVAQGLASWLAFERRCGRQNLFCESYLAHALGQLLTHQYSGQVLPEQKHPVLSAARNGAGRRPCYDFAVFSREGVADLAIETKWASASPTLLRDLVRDLVRLDLLVPQHAREAILILAGERRRINRLFARSEFKPHASHPHSTPLLPIESYSRTSVRLVPAHTYRRSLYRDALRKFATIPIRRSIRVERGGWYDAAKEYRVFVWRIIKYGGQTFLPEEVFGPYDEPNRGD